MNRMRAQAGWATRFASPFLWCAPLVLVAALTLTHQWLIGLAVLLVVALLVLVNLQHARLTGLARTDPLTGLANHRGFHEALATELARARRDRGGLAVVSIDLDDFKRVNEHHGHPYGDEVLVAVAESLRSVVRGGDLAARTGGEEFGLVLPATDVAAALKVAERAREAVSRVPVPELELRCSAGVACYPADASDATALSQVASGALSWAKRTGKSRTRRFDPKHATPGEISELAAGVRMTLSKEGAIATVFQPVVALATGSVVGYEALTRFPTTERSPHACFAEAHACGLGPELEGAAIRSALAPLGRPAGTHLALNVSPSALGGAAIREALPADLSELVIEITENEVADASDQLRGELRELRERGARIALDDAGAGYSGLKQLMSLRPDIVKLDRDLIAGIHDDPARLALVESFVRFAQQVEATVCAEGIESLDDLAAVADLDVHWGQGFALARPASEWPGVAPVAAQVCRTTLAEALRVAPSGAEPSAATGERQLERLSAQLADASSREDLESCLSLIAAGLHADAVSLSGWKADEGILETLAQRAGVEGDSRFALSDYPLTARVLETREAAQVLAGDPSADPNEVELLLFYGYRSLLLVPVVHGGRSLGVVEAYSRDERAWTRAQIILARIIANQLAPTIEALPPWEETQPDQRRRLGGAT